MDLKYEYDVVRLDKDGSVNVAGVVSPMPDSEEEAFAVLKEAWEDCPSDRLALRRRPVGEWERLSPDGWRPEASSAGDSEHNGDEKEKDDMAKTLIPWPENRKCRGCPRNVLLERRPNGNAWCDLPECEKGKAKEEGK